MKKIIFGTIAVLLMASCAGKNGSETTNDGSIGIPDSVVRVDSERIETETVAESATMDTVPQASKEKEEEPEVSIPTFREIEKSRDTASLFRKKGFKVSVKKHFYEGDGEYIPHVTATYDSGNGISCKYSDWLLGFTITIKGAPEILEKFYSDAKSYIEKEKRKGENWNECWSLTKKGDTIEIYYPDAC